MGHIPDGIFNFIGETIEILSAPERTINELLSLAKIIKKARTNAESKDQVEKRIKKELPGLSLLAKILPENKNELYVFLSLVLAALPLFKQAPEKQANQTTINITQVIENVITEGKNDTSQNPHHASNPKQGRNEPCNCGSGIKYKKCCGHLK